MTTNTDGASADLKDMVEKLFAFLLPRTSEVQTELRRSKLVVAYCSPEITFEIEVDSRERQVFVLVCRSDSGQRPAGYYVSGGVRVRMHLEEVVAMMRPNPGGRRPSPEQVAARQDSSIKGQLEHFAGLLREHESELRAGALDVLDRAVDCAN